MKKLILSLAVVASVLIGCETNEQNPIESEFTETTSLQKAEKQCFTMDVLGKNMNNDPSLKGKMEAVESFTNEYVSKVKKGEFSQRLVNGKIQIPVVFHVIYKRSSENVSLAVLQDQITAMNEDFNLQNPNRGSLPAEFAGVEANVEVDFVIESVIRVQNKKKRRWRPDDSMKFASSGGSDVVNPQEFLNIWIVNYMPYQTGQILGYAQFPGGSWSTDGVVLAAPFVGRNQRTATHEVGHWLNLRHIWGDGGCGASDFVADTPDADGPSRGCPSYPTNECGSNNMTMNFMDYSDDNCMYMFTQGQKTRMDAVFAPGGFRATMAD
ncbi:MULTISPECIES: zinc metalloprotease [Tenacibaculum]|uniref:zinc metalloprotease n=1 Tax=Tenacibaculum TaxID=104267 RepID=UPI000895297F|nr:MULTISPECIES: zinc metalloprotease [unclassified Tenacibaculum]RBW59151.1 zinc metalloprotease [Tenacibaculum sp. E3R01]SEE12268.1 Pregnancy-associated plasma protein-A [Tenacibaculum sp. MAR_2010_89]